MARVGHVATLSTLQLYRRHLQATGDWIALSMRKGRGGSCAHFSPLAGWSRPYPETTGYLIPTLLDLSRVLGRPEMEVSALSLGIWLRSIQAADGYWIGGLHPPTARQSASIFNTGQILRGMIALYEHTGEREWLNAAIRGASWMTRSQERDGLWPSGDYRASSTPSYYAYAVAPLLRVWQCAGDDEMRIAAEKFLRVVCERRRENGAFRQWGFSENAAAPTHTIAYTIQGLLESASILNDWSNYGEPVVAALEFLWRRAELRGGRLAGAYDENWSGDHGYVCLTGQAQVASCLLAWERQEKDLRIVNGAAKCVDVVCKTQALSSVIPGLRGAVAGSSPMWGAYMRFRYPNWAAKYFCDALTDVTRRIEQEL